VYSSHQADNSIKAPTNSMYRKLLSKPICYWPGQSVLSSGIQHARTSINMTNTLFLSRNIGHKIY